MNTVISKFVHRQFMIASDFEVNHYKEAYFKPPEFHSHEFYEIYLFLDGNVTYYIEEKTYELCRGDLLIIPPEKMHRPVIETESYAYERIVLWINRSFIEDMDDEDNLILKKLDELGAKNIHLVHLNGETLEILLSLLHKLILSERTEDIGKKMLSKGYISVILVMLCRSFFNSIVLEEDKSNIDVIPKVIVYINEHISEPITLTELSQKFYLSKFHLERKFKEYTNATIYEYIIGKRILAAKRYLRDGMPATSVSIQCGFSDYSNFYKSFCKRVGMSPKKYKLMMGMPQKERKK